MKKDNYLNKIAESKKPFIIYNLEEYLFNLKEKKILYFWHDRQKFIRRSLLEVCSLKNFFPLIKANLLDETTGSIDFPHCLLCDFDQDFLKLPKELLIINIEKYQKSFPVVDENGKLQPHFVVVSNMESNNSGKIIQRYQSIMNGRLSDAAFFYNEDLKKSPESYLNRLKNTVFQSSLGSIYERAIRISNVAFEIARLSGFNEIKAKKSGLLSSIDLPMKTIQEFPELQGTLAKYYLFSKNEDVEVANALEQQYWPKFSNARLPTYGISSILSIAEKIDSIVGFFGIGKVIKSDKDPYSLRRKAIGILRILLDKSIKVKLSKIIKISLKSYASTQLDFCFEDCHKFFLERLRSLYINKLFRKDIFESVLHKQNDDVVDFNLRIKSISFLSKESNFNKILKGNKRIMNILKRVPDFSRKTLDTTLFVEKEEHDLYEVYTKALSMSSLVPNTYSYKELLQEISNTIYPLESFFENVLVNHEDCAVKNNRIILLNKLQKLFNVFFYLSKIK